MVTYPSLLDVTALIDMFKLLHNLVTSSDIISSGGVYCSNQQILFNFMRIYCL